LSAGWQKDYSSAMPPYAGSLKNRLSVNNKNERQKLNCS
jgi:hypothetical protein